MVAWVECGGLTPHAELGLKFRVTVTRSVNKSVLLRTLVTRLAVSSLNDEHRVTHMDA